jgi:UDP-glucose:(heptosyl)LPS alpha-1,3-glucosyltransferase
MRIAFLIWSYSPSRGGQERYLSRLIAALSSDGHEVHVYAARFEEPSQPGVHLHRVRTPSRSSFLKTLFFLRRASRMLAGESYDVISGMTRFYPLDVYRLGSGLHTVWMKKKTHNPLVRLASFMRPFNWLALYIERKIFDPRNCSHIIANSVLCRNQLLSNYRYPENRVTVVYNGIDHDRFHPRLREEHRNATLARLELPLHQPTAVFVSTNLRRKGLEVVIHALSLLTERKISLVVVGGGEMGRYRRLARRLGVDDRIRFVGHVRDVRPFYGASDFLVLPTLYDPFANVCLEAMACALPVITTTDNGASEIIDDAEDGFVIPDPRDARELSSRMAALADRRIREAMSSAARVKATLYTIEKNADETLAVYRKAREGRTKLTPARRRSDVQHTFIVNDTYLHLLKANLLDSFEAFMSCGSSLLKDKGRRAIHRIELPPPERTGIYIKRHLRGSTCDAIKAMMKGARPSSPAAVEWRAIAALNAHHVRTMEAIACGESNRFPWRHPSFIATAEVKGNRLEDYVHFLRGKFHEKRCIISELADTVRKMHRAGFNHRDLYLSHIFLEEKEKVNRIVLIDLQRVQRKASAFNRWVVKDIAALNYSSPSSVVTRTDRMRFLLRYLGRKHLGGEGKRLAKRIERKTGRIRRHDRKRGTVARRGSPPSR